MKLYLHLGSGASPRTFEDAKTIHLDCVEAPHVEIICNLNHGIPLPANLFDAILAANILEHLEDTIAIMNEMHRVLVPNGIVWIQVPLFGTPNHVTDPTHRHGFTMDSFDFFDDETTLGEFNGKLYTPRRWRILRKQEKTQDVLLEMQALKPGEARREVPDLFGALQSCEKCL